MINNKDFWAKENTVKPDYEHLDPYRRRCEACFKTYTTTVLWSKRCDPCKKSNRPKRKIISSLTINDNPF